MLEVQHLIESQTYSWYSQQIGWFLISLSSPNLQATGTSSRESVSKRHSPAPASRKLANIVTHLTQWSLQPSSIPTYTRAWKLFTQFHSFIFHTAQFTLPIYPATLHVFFSTRHITFDITNGTYKPYRKPNNEPLYINRLSNHQPSIIRQLPSSINKRINKLSCNQETFNEAAPLYNDALKRSNFDTTLMYEPTNQDNRINSQRRNRQRNVIWYNPPYSRNVRTNAGRDFLELIDKHFQPSHKLHKLFNRHTVRVSYSWTENMKSFIRKHNNHTLTKNTTQNHTTNKEPRKCNCRRPDECPVAGNCSAKSLVYQAKVTTTDNGETKKYIGVTSNNEIVLLYSNNTSRAPNLRAYPVYTFELLLRSNSTTWRYRQEDSQEAINSNVIAWWRSVLWYSSRKFWGWNKDITKADRCKGKRQP